MGAGGREQKAVSGVRATCRAEGLQVSCSRSCSLGQGLQDDLRKGNAPRGSGGWSVKKDLANIPIFLPYKIENFHMHEKKASFQLEGL